MQSRDEIVVVGCLLALLFASLPNFMEFLRLFTLLELHLPFMVDE
jgi:hypothetical protein